MLGIKPRGPAWRWHDQPAADPGRRHRADQRHDGNCHGHEHSCALNAIGGVECWGDNEYGQLGDGTSEARNAPVNVVRLSSGLRAIAAGGGHTCALTGEGGIKCWGDNQFGQLGDGTTTNRNSPVDVVGLSSNVTAISAGGAYTCALTTNGGVECWGGNYNGQLGDGTTNHRSTPMDVVGFSSGALAIAAGNSHTCALTTSGGVECWGRNDYGQIGDGTSNDLLMTVPIGVAGLSSGVASIFAGGDHTCALTGVGDVKCWGINNYGQIGNGTGTLWATPVDVVGLSWGVRTIAAGGFHTCALIVGGGIKCWGDNEYGEIGDGTKSSYPFYRPTPEGVSGLDGGATAISAGGEHTCALTVGGVECWGHNKYGQLGDSSTADRLTPVDVPGLPGGVRMVAAGRETLVRW